MKDIKRYISLLCLSMLLLACGRNEDYEGERYKKYEIKIIYEGCYVDTVYEIGHTTAQIVLGYPGYVNKEGQKVELPKNVIKIRLRELPKPVEAIEKEHPPVSPFNKADE